MTTLPAEPVPIVIPAVYGNCPVPIPRIKSRCNSNPMVRKYHMPLNPSGNSTCWHLQCFQLAIPAPSCDHTPSRTCGNSICSVDTFNVPNSHPSCIWQLSCDPIPRIKSRFNSNPMVRKYHMPLNPSGNSTCWHLQCFQLAIPAPSCDHTPSRTCPNSHPSCIWQLSCAHSQN